MTQSRNERIMAAVERAMDPDERVEARGVCWAAVRRPKVPLLILGRHQYDVVLTDRRVLMFSRRRRRRLNPDDVAFAKRYAAITLESGRGRGFPLARHHIATDTGRRLVVEWRPRHRDLARRFTAALTAPRAPSRVDVAVVLAVDAGTTGVRTLAVDADGRPGAMAYREFPQHFPQPGWVEHDADDILSAALATLAEVATVVQDAGETVAAIGITNQRETVVAWDRRTGRPRHRALVWQDRRTAGACDRLRADGHEPLVRARTGLVLDPYFSATKAAWLLRDGGVEVDDALAIGTVDAWLCWNLTGAFVTEPSNASRTLLYDIVDHRWSEELCALFGVPPHVLPKVRPSSGRFGVTDPARAAGLAVPVSGIAGDQQASLFGQACVAPGMTKNTYGTGSFVLMNLGSAAPEPVEGVLTTVAWQLGDDITYALEGAVFVTGAAIQWLRDGLGILESSSDAGPLAASVPDTGGAVFVPALTGLGAPYWDPYARGAIVGLTRGTTRAHLVRAAVEAMAWQTRDVVDAMTQASGRAITSLRIDGGASVMDLLCQLQADVLDTEVRRSAVRETTALGAAFLAGLAEGVWDDVESVAAHWHDDGRWEPSRDPGAVDADYERWRRAVERARAWETTPAE